MKANRINDILTECNHYQNVSMEIWKRITLTHIDREFSTKVRAICNEGREAIKENYRIVCEQLQFVREHTELDPTYRRDIIEYYDMLLNKAQNLPVKDVIEQMEQIRQRVRNKLNTIKKYVGSLREGV